MTENDREPDPQTALPQTEEWSNAPTEEVGLTDDQAPLDDNGSQGSDGQPSETDAGGGDSSPPGTPDEPPAQNKDANGSARQHDDQTDSALGEGIEDL
jgi:hypothetical protein